MRICPPFLHQNYRGGAHFLHANVAEVNALELVNRMPSLGDVVIA